MGYKLTALITSILLSGAVFLATFLENFYIFIVLFCFIFVLTGGIGYMVPFDVCYLYFPKKKGLISGAISSAFGFGAFVFGFIALILVNPNNE